MFDIPLIDILALAWFVFVWAAYTSFADNFNSDGRTLLTVMQKKREQWMLQMLKRDNRVVDSTLMASIMRSVALFASTTILILAGLLAIMGAVDKAQAVFADVPMIAKSSRLVWELKILTLLAVFVYAFFKFAWGLRQFNYALVLLGAAPLPDESDTPEAKDYAFSTARVISGGVLNFNRGMRAYYFGLATLSWFLHPFVFMAASLWVILVMYRREFRSKTLDQLENVPNIRL